MTSTASGQSDETEAVVEKRAAGTFAASRIGIAAKIRAGVGALLAVTVAICIGLLIFLIQFGTEVDSLSNDSLPSIVLFAELERSLDNILFDTAELAEARDERSQRSISDGIQAELDTIAAILQDPVLSSQITELQALYDVITTSLTSLNEKVVERIEIESLIQQHNFGMRELRRLAAADALPAGVNALLADLEEASQIDDRYRLRIISNDIGNAYQALTRGPGPQNPPPRRQVQRALPMDQRLPPRGSPPPPRSHDDPLAIRPIRDNGVLLQDLSTLPDTLTPEQVLAPLISPIGGLLRQRDEFLKTSAAVRGLQSEVEAIVADFAYVAQARFERFREVADENAVRMQVVSDRITRLLVASLATSLLVAYLVSRSLRVNVSSRLADLRENILSEARKVSRRQGDTQATLAAEQVDEIAAISGSVDVFLSVIGDANERLRRNLETIERDVDLARLMQEAIVPSAFPDHPAYSISASMTAARHVGGDFYEFIPLDDDHIAVAIADVSGKGVAAALFMVMSLTVLEVAAKSGAGPAHVIDHVNRKLFQQNPLFHFVTMFYGVLNIKTGRLSYCNAGHNPPMVIHDGACNALPLTGNAMLGVFDNQEFEEYEIDLAPGDTLYLYTDGVTESFSETMEEFGEKRLKDSLANATQDDPAAAIETVQTSVQRFIGDAEQSDDLTMLALRYNGLAGAAALPHNYLIVEIPNTLEAVSTVHSRMEDFYAAQGIPDDVQFQTNLCIEEYIVNLIQYGFSDEKTHTIRIAATRTPTGLEVVLTDDSSVPFDPLSVDEADTSSNLAERQPGGLGIHIIRNFMDNLSYSVTDKGNRFSMVKHLPKAA